MARQGDVKLSLFSKEDDRRKIELLIHRCCSQLPFVSKITYFKPSKLYEVNEIEFLYILSDNYCIFSYYHVADKIKIYVLLPLINGYL